MSQTDLHDAEVQEAKETQNLEEGQAHEAGEASEVSQAPSIDWEQKARDTGWKPPSEWQGDLPPNYIDDPKVWVHTRPFADQLARERREARKLQEDIEEIKRFTQSEREFHIKELEKARRQAIDDGDHEAFDRAESRLKHLSQQPERKAAPVDTDPTAPGGKQDPAYLAWKSANSWYEQDQGRTNYAMHVAVAEVQNSGLTVKDGRAYYDAISRVVERDLGPAKKPSEQVVNRQGEGQGEGQSGGTKKTLWSRLPQGTRDNFTKTAAFRRGVFSDDQAGRERYARIYLQETGEL